MLLIRRIIIIFLGALFIFPALALILNAFIKADISSDDFYAMLFCAFMFLIIGTTLWWVAYDMKRKQRKNDTDLTAVGLSQMPHISDHTDIDSMLD